MTSVCGSENSVKNWKKKKNQQKTKTTQNRTQSEKIRVGCKGRDGKYDFEYYSMMTEPKMTSEWIETNNGNEMLAFLAIRFSFTSTKNMK